MSARLLAASVRPLGEVLVDALRTERPPRSLAALARPVTDENSDQDSLPFPHDDDNAVVEDIVPVVLRPDEVAVAILLGKAFEHQRPQLTRLQDRGQLTVFEVATADYAAALEKVLRHHVFGPAAKVVRGDEMSLSNMQAAPVGTVALFTRSADTKGRDAAKDLAFVAAIQKGCAVVAIAPDPDARLPPDILRVADHRCVIPPLDAATVAAVITAVTGGKPGRIDDDLCRHLTLQQLMVAVRSDLGARRCVVRLEKLARKSSREPTPLLSQMHGLGKAKEWGLSLIADLREYAAGRLDWACVDKGVILTGIPGVGKTSFARALAREAGVAFIATSYAQWQATRDGHLGAVTSAIRKTFSDARAQAPCVVVIDEIDTLRARGNMTQGKNDDWWVAIMNVVLECLDGYERRQGVVVIGICNTDVWRLDPALVRAGRLDRHIEMTLPDVPGLAGILRTHLGDDLAGVDLVAVATAAAGCTGSDIERAVRDARRLVRRAGRDLTLDDILVSIRDGRPTLSESMRWHCAYHEAGHALSRVLVKIGQPVAISINDTGGFVTSTPSTIEPQTLSYMKRHLIALLGGRAAELVAFGEPSAGAGGDRLSDLARANEIATAIELNYGLGRFGLVWLDQQGHGDLLFNQTLQSAVRATLDEASAAAVDLLTSRRSKLDALAQALFTRSYLERDEIEAICRRGDDPPVDADGIALAPEPESEAETEVDANGVRT